MPRVFFALRPTPAIRAALHDAVSNLVVETHATPVSPDNLHLTLCFLGRVDDARVEDLRRLAASIRARRCELELRAFDFWTKPKILCAIPCGKESEEAKRLAEALTIATSAAGFSPDARTWRPHLTLARKVRRDAGHARRWPMEFSPGFVVDCDRFVLMESRRNDAGSAYSVVDSWALYEK